MRSGDMDLFWGFLLGVAFVILVAGVNACEKGRSRASPGAVAQAPTVKKAADDMGPPIATIKTEARAIAKEAPQVEHRTDRIDAAAGDLLVIQSQLEDAHKMIASSEKECEALRGKVEGLEKKNKDLQAQHNSLLSRLLAGLAVVAVIAGVAVFWLPIPNKLGLAAGCGLMFVVAISAQFLLAWAVWFALALGVLIVGGAFWVFFIQGKSLAEVVKSAEAFKNKVAPDIAEEVKSKLEQSKATQRVVKVLRTKLGLTKNALVGGVA